MTARLVPSQRTEHPSGSHANAIATRDIVMNRVDGEELTQPTRRVFCTQACRAMSALVAGGVLHGCGGGGNPAGPSGGNSATALPVVSASASGNTVSVSVDAGSPLASVGGSALVQTSGGSFLVARTAQDRFTVLTATCTHEACTITGHNAQTYVCPCHGSQFNASGGVVNGPATRPLTSFPATFSANVLSFNV